MSTVFMLTRHQWEELVQRMYGEGVLRPALLSDADGIGMAGMTTDMILWLSHLAELVEDPDHSPVDAMQHLRYLVDQVESRSDNVWWLYNVHVME